MNRGYDYRRHAVLYVDDEEKSLKYFTRALEEDFRILTAPSAAEAEELLAAEDAEVGVLVADQRMPGQTGVELLTGVRRSRPGIVRILTTAYSDLDSAIDAVNDGAVFRYVVKPWDIGELRAIMRSAMEFFLVQKERDQLLRQKMSVLQRMLESDRKKSFALLASIAGARLRNAPAAVEAFLRQAPTPAGNRSLSGAAAHPGAWEESLARAREESRRLLAAVRRAARVALEPPVGFDDRVSAEDLVREVLGSEAPEADGEAAALEAAPDLPELRASAAMLRELVGSLLRLAREISPEGGRPAVVVRPQDADGAREGVVISVQPAGEWDSREVGALFGGEGSNGSGEDCGDLLACFLAAYHHGGRLHVRIGGEGEGFEVRLPADAAAAEPVDPEEDWIEPVVVGQELWEVESTTGPA